MRAMHFRRNRTGIAVTLVTSLCASVGLAATLDVPANTEVTAEASATYDAISIEGTLTVPKGITVDTGDTGTMTLGTTSEAKLVVDGGTFGRNPVAATKNTPALNIGGNGGSAKISLVNGGALKCGDAKINANTKVDDSGYIDYLTVDGNSTLTCRDFYNNATAPARTRILSGTTTFTTEGGASYTHYRRGSWVFDVAGGATVLFSRAYRNWESLTSADSVYVDFTGAGDVAFSGANDNAFTVLKGTTFGHSGKIVNKARLLAFNDGVVIGDSVSGVEAKGPIQFKGNVNIGDIEVSGSGVLNGPATGTAKITLGRADRDSTINGAAFAADTTLVLDKVGAGELTVSATTPYLPELNVEDGAVRIQGALTCAKMTLAAGTSITVDGGAWTVEGAQLVQATGAEIGFVRGGKLIVKTVNGESPTFASGEIVPVAEYWIDGVKQSNGQYVVGGATLDVYEYVEPTEIWTNEGKSGNPYAFLPNEEYLGFSLIAGTAPTDFTGGPVTLGSSGIAVTAESPVTYGFGLSLFPAINQTWSFGGASASFTAPFVSRGNEIGGKVTISSDADIVLAATNSTFSGSFEVTARSILVSGRHALGIGSDVSSLAINNQTSGSKIVLQDVDFAQEVTLALGSTSTRSYLSFQGTNRLQRCSFGESTRGGTYAGNSKTVYNGPVSYANYNCWALGRDANIVYKGPVTFGGWTGSRCFEVVVSSSADYGTPRIRFEAQNSIPADNVYFANFQNVRVETAADHAFSRGWLKTSASTTIDLCGFDQCVTRIDGTGKVTSSEPAFLELAPGESTELSNKLAFEGKAGIRMVGAGTVRLTGDYDSEGAIAVTNGCLTLATTCLNVTTVSVTEKGCLAVEQAKPFDRAVVSLTLGCEGALAVRSGAPLRVASLTLVNPSTGVSATYTSGEFTAANTFGLISEGTVSVGCSGLILIYR